MNSTTLTTERIAELDKLQAEKGWRYDAADTEVRRSDSTVVEWPEVLMTITSVCFDEWHAYSLAKELPA